MTRADLITACQSAADAGVIEKAELTFSVPDVVIVVPTPPPPVGVTDLTGTYDAAKKQAVLKYTFDPAKNPYKVQLFVAGGWYDPSVADTNGDAKVPMSPGESYDFRVVDVDGTPSNAVTVTAPAPTPPPKPTNESFVSAGTSLAAVQARLKPDTTFVFEAGIYPFDGKSGLLIHDKNVKFRTKGGPVVIRNVGTKEEFATGIRVYEDNFDLGDGFIFEGPAKTRGLEIVAAAGTRIGDCSSANLGQFIQGDEAKDVTITGGSYRLNRYFAYGSFEGLEVSDVTIGSSRGAGVPMYLADGTKNPKWFDSEHGMRLVRSKRVRVHGCTITEPKKGCIQIRDGCEDVEITGNTLSGAASVTVGPLGDRDGLKDKDKESALVRVVVIKDNMCDGPISLEMGCEALTITGNTINGKSRAAIQVVDDPRYLPVRKHASGTIERNTWTGAALVSGPTGRLTINSNP
jgi:hypothetical protein